MNNRYIYTRILIISLITIVGSFIYAYVAYVLHRDIYPNSLISIWNTWDTQHYIKIAMHGYSNTIIAERNLLVVFLPLFPLMIKIFSFVFQNYLLSGLIVSNLFYVVSVYYLYKLVSLDYKEDDALKSVIYFSVFPSAYFLHAAYTESLFIALTVASFYYARNDKWAISGILGMLSAMTRVTGILILPVLLIEYLHQKNFKKENIKYDIMWIFVISLGFLVYLIINFITYDNPFKFMEIQKDHWGMKLSFPLKGFLHAYSSIGHDSANYMLNQGWMQMFFAILGLALTVYSFFRLRLSYSLYCSINWLVFTSTSFWISVPRFTLTLFPIFIVLALLGRRKEINYAIIFISLLLYSLYLSEFVIFKWAF